jgi:hypothetical protein
LLAATHDPILQRIKHFRCPRGALFAQRRDRGYTLRDTGYGAPVERPRPSGGDDTFEVLCGSLWKQRRASTGRFAHSTRSIDDALQFIAPEDIFWVMT